MTDCGDRFQFVAGGTFPPLAFHGTRQEQQEFITCVLRGFGPTPAVPYSCECHPAYNAYTSQQIGFHMCPAHQFVNEDDGRCKRPDRMQFVKSLRARLLAEEGILHHCVRCQEIYQISHVCRMVVDRPAGESFPW